MWSIDSHRFVDIVITDVCLIHGEVLVDIDHIFYRSPNFLSLFVLFEEIVRASNCRGLYNLSFLKIRNVCLPSLKWLLSILINLLDFYGAWLSWFEKLIFIVLSVGWHLHEIRSIEITDPSLIHILTRIITQSLCSTSLIQKQVMNLCLFIIWRWSEETLCSSSKTSLLTLEVTWARILYALSWIILHSTIEILFGSLFVFGIVEIWLKAIGSRNINEWSWLVWVSIGFSCCLLICCNLWRTNSWLFATSSIGTVAKSLLMTQICKHFFFLLWILWNFIAFRNLWLFMTFQKYEPLTINLHCCNVINEFFDRVSSALFELYLT